MNRLASIYIRLAARLMHEQRNGDWARAMRSELEHISEGEQIDWALGCLIAAIKRRLTPMQNGTLRVSRWVLLFELLVCFLPITIGWFDIVLGPSGVSRWDSRLIEQHFLGTALGTSILAMMIGGAIIWLAGPIGLCLGLRAVATGTGLRSRRLGISMIAGILAYAVASLILRLFGGPGAYAATVDFLILIVVLPIAAIAHLMYLATPADQESDSSAPA